VADELPLTTSPDTRSDDLDELDDRVRDIAALVTYMTSAAADADRSANGNRAPSARTTRHKVAVLTHAVGTLTQALAHLGDAVASAGHLHQVDAQPSSAERRAAQRSTHTTVNEQVDRTRRDLNEAGRYLHHCANRFPAPPPDPTPPSPPAPAGAPIPQSSAAATSPAPRIR
jgi:hypothetical protein